MTIHYCHPDNGYDFSTISAYSSTLTYTSGATSAVVHNNVAFPNRWVYEYTSGTAAAGQPLTGAAWTLRADGTSGYPYKTADNAASGLTGNDEVRIAASPPSSALDGIFAFTQASATVYITGATSGQFTTGDMIGTDSIGFWEVQSTSGTPASALTIRNSFASSGGTNATLSGTLKLGAFTKEFTSRDEVWQNFQNINGTSTGRLKISGDWDLTTNTQGSGYTYFMSSNTTAGTGVIFQFPGNSYIELDKIGFARSYTGIYLSSSVLYWCSFSNLKFYRNGMWITTNSNAQFQNSWFTNFQICGGGRDASVGCRTTTLSNIHWCTHSSWGIRYTNNDVYLIDCVFSNLSNTSTLAYCANYPTILRNCKYYNSNTWITYGTTSNDSWMQTPIAIHYCFNGNENDHRLDFGFNRGQVYSETSIRHTDSGYAWKATRSTYTLVWELANILAKENTPLTISLWSRSLSASSANYSGILYLYEYGWVGDVLAVTSGTLASGNTWQETVLNYTPSSNTNLSLYVNITSGTFYLDDLQVSS